MATGSIEFIALLLLLTSGYFYVPSARGRRAVLSACSVGFIAQFLPNLESAAFLAAFLVVGYAVGCRLRARPDLRLFAFYLVVLVAVFGVVQRYAVAELLLGDLIRGHTVVVIGISYMLFRQIHFNVDAMQGQIPQSTLWSYLNYQINFLALVAGPIQRYQEFAHCWNDSKPLFETRHEVLKTYLRIFIGVICVAGISTALLDAHDSMYAALAKADPKAAAGAPLATTLKALAVFYLYPVYMYFNFAGYCDIVIGGAALIGIRLPENFDRPYLARNILDFWTRWHQSLGFWVRDYLFTPMYKSLAEWDSRKAPALAFLCYFVAFVVMGIWHGTGLGFLIFGLLHGAGASSAKLWEMYLVRTRGRKGLRQYLQSPGVRFIAILCTLHYFAFSLLFFSNGLEKFLISSHAVRHAWFGA
jgi:alginate O-acetyltransferase complex protein AlgI